MVVDTFQIYKPAAALRLHGDGLVGIERHAEPSSSSTRRLSSSTSTSSSATRAFRFRLRRAAAACHLHGPWPSSESFSSPNVLCATFGPACDGERDTRHGGAVGSAQGRERGTSCRWGARACAEGCRVAVTGRFALFSSFSSSSALRFLFNASILRWSSKESVPR